MPPDWNSVFNRIYTLRASRNVLLREAISYSLVSQTVTLASDSIFPAKVLWRSDGSEMRRGTWLERDQASLVIWFKDLTGTNISPSDASLLSVISRVKGQVNEGTGENYSRFIVDGQELKVRDVFPVERPDGKIYALKIVLQAAE